MAAYDAVRATVYIELPSGSSLPVFSNSAHQGLGALRLGNMSVPFLIELDHLAVPVVHHARVSPAAAVQS